MANSRLCLRFTLLLFCAFLFITHSVKCDIYVDEEDNLLRGINSYRIASNLTILTKNDNAKCFANELVEQMKSQPCTNSTEPQRGNYSDILTKCDLSVDGSIVPVCLQDLDVNLVLSDLMKSPYSGDFRDNDYTGVGIGWEDHWFVIVLTKNTPAGIANSVSRIGATSFHLFLLVSFFLVF